MQIMFLLINDVHSVPEQKHVFQNNLPHQTSQQHNKATLLVPQTFQGLSVRHYEVRGQSQTQFLPLFHSRSFYQFCITHFVNHVFPMATRLSATPPLPLFLPCCRLQTQSEALLNLFHLSSNFTLETSLGRAMTSQETLPGFGTTRGHFYCLRQSLDEVLAL